MKYVVLLGRILFAAIFLTGGIHHFSGQSIGYASSHGVPMASVLVPAAGILAILGGHSVLLGYKAKLGAWLLIIFLIPVTLWMHDFWNVSDMMMRQMQMANFMKNICMLGGGFLISYFGAGPLSLDARMKKPAREEEKQSVRMAA